MTFAIFYCLEAGHKSCPREEITHDMPERLLGGGGRVSLEGVFAERI